MLSLTHAARNGEMRPPTILCRAKAWRRYKEQFHCETIHAHFRSVNGNDEWVIGGPEAIHQHMLNMTRSQGGLPDFVGQYLWAAWNGIIGPTLRPMLNHPESIILSSLITEAWGVYPSLNTSYMVSWEQPNLWFDMMAREGYIITRHPETNYAYHIMPIDRKALKEIRELVLPHIREGWPLTVVGRTRELGLKTVAVLPIESATWRMVLGTFAIPTLENTWIYQDQTFVCIPV